MSLLAPGLVLDAMVPLYLLSAFLIAGLGAGVLLFERFTVASRRFFVLAVLVAASVAPLGLTHAVATTGMQHFWLRVAYVFIPLSLPGLYWVAQSMTVAAPRSRMRLLWGLGAVFSVVNLAGPWLVDGLQSLFLARTLGSGGWVGAAYVLFEAVVIVLSLHHLATSRRSAASEAEEKERLLLTAAAAIGFLTVLDYFLAVDPFRAGLITPLGLLLAAALVTVSAVRYRLFAPGDALATDEVLRAMSDAVLVCDAKGRIRGSNPAAHRLLGRSDTRLLGMPVGKVVGRWHGTEWREWQPGGTSGMEELELRSAGDEPVPVSVSAEPVRFGSRLAGSVIVARDIRERLEAERALQASERRYQSLFWHNPAILYEFDLEGLFVAANPAAESLLGRPVDQLLGRPFADVIEPGDLDRAFEVFETVLTGEAQEYEISVLAEGGEQREIRGVSIPIFDQGEVVGVFGVALDVSEQTRVKRELEVQRGYFAGLFESSPEGIVLVDAETDRVVRVNEEFTRMFGYTSEDAVGRDLNELIVPNELLREGSQMNEAARQSGRLQAETVRRRKDGTRVHVSVVARKLPLLGEREQLYGVYRDITDRKEAEQALREREEELRHAQKLEAVGKLAGGIAHDFNNLLTVINGHAGFALESLEPGSPLQEDLLEIEKAGARAAALTQQLLAYSRRQVLHPQLLDANAVVLEVQEMLRRLIGEHIRVETRLTQEDVRVRADRGQFEQVLVNLVVNARDAMPDGGTLTLETDLLTLEPGDPRVERWEVEPGPFVRLRVSDTGLGMDADTLDHAFEPFFTTKEQGKGTGLGLATVFGIVKQSGGHVMASSEPGQGTVCDVVLPHVVSAPTPAAVAEREPPAAQPEGTILLVEDEAAVRKLAVRVLERAGCTVLSAENGVRALEVVEAHGGHLDLVVTDLVMPEMGGHELARQLRRRRPDLPVLFMSGYDDEFIDSADGGSSFLAKPFTPAALADRVAEALAAADTARSA